MTPPTAPPPKLFAVEADGPRELPIPEGCTDLHPVFDRLPLGIYEALRTYRHARFLGLDEHLARARASCEAAGIPNELDEGALRAALHRIATDYEAEDSRIRFDILREAPIDLGTDSRVLIGIGPHTPPSVEELTEGVHVGLSDALRRESPAVKAASWVLDRRPLETDPALADVLLVDEDGRLLECTKSNFFGVRNGVLYTSPDGVLHGITRLLVMNLANELVIPLRQVALRREDIPSLHEAFLTSSSREILPIVEIDGEIVAGGEPGPVTQRLMAAYAHLARTRSRTAVTPEATV